MSQEAVIYLSQFVLAAIQILDAQLTAANLKATGWASKWRPNHSSRILACSLLAWLCHLNLGMLACSKVGPHPL